MNVCVCMYVKKGEKKEGKTCESGMWMVFVLAEWSQTCRHLERVSHFCGHSFNDEKQTQTKLQAAAAHRREWKNKCPHAFVLHLLLRKLWMHSELKKQWLFSFPTCFPIYPLQLKCLARHQQDLTLSFCCWSEAEVPDLTAQGLNGADRASVITGHSGVVVLLLSPCSSWNDL